MDSRGAAVRHPAASGSGQTAAADHQSLYLSSKGIRKIRRWHTTTDTLGNVLETLCVIWCFVWPFVPDATLWYGLILAFTLLCAISRCAIIALKQTKAIPVRKSGW